MKREQSWALSCLCFECDFTTANRLLFSFCIYIYSRGCTQTLPYYYINGKSQDTWDCPEKRKCVGEWFTVLPRHVFLFWVSRSKEVEGSFDLPLSFPLVTEFIFLPTWAKIINQNSTEVKGDKAVYSCKKGLLSSLMTQFVDQWTTRSVDYLILLSGRALSIYWMNIRSLTEHKGKDLCRKR